MREEENELLNHKGVMSDTIIRFIQGELSRISEINPEDGRSCESSAKTTKMAIWQPPPDSNVRVRVRAFGYDASVFDDEAHCLIQGDIIMQVTEHQAKSCIALIVARCHELGVSGFE